MHTAPEAPDPQSLRRRPAARLLVVDPAGRILLFHYKPPSGTHDYWFTPGGGVDPGETFEQTALRELREETGIVVDHIPPHLEERTVPIQMFSGEYVMAVERYYLLRVPFSDLSREGWTQEELSVNAEHKWWLPQDLAASGALYYPENLLELIPTPKQI